MKPFILSILLITFSIPYSHAQEISKSELTKEQNAKQDLINKTTLKNQEANKKQLKTSTTSQDKVNLNIDYNAAIELKINYLREQSCCEEEIAKLKTQLK